VERATITTPLLVVICSGEGAWVTDVASRCYLDFLAGYSALNFGHRHPAPVDAAAEQLNRLTLTSGRFITRCSVRSAAAEPPRLNRFHR
jgi:4-aminobutyrate aminotransferase-like enzyme